jgi:hypothetical protein
VKSHSPMIGDRRNKELTGFEMRAGERVLAFMVAGNQRANDRTSMKTREYNAAFFRRRKVT